MYLVTDGDTGEQRFGELKGMSEIQNAAQIGKYGKIQRRECFIGKFNMFNHCLRRQGLK